MWPTPFWFKQPNVTRQIRWSCNLNIKYLIKQNTSKLYNFVGLWGHADILICILTTVASHRTGCGSLKNLHKICKVQISLKCLLFMFCWPVLGWPCCTSHHVVVVSQYLYADIPYSGCSDLVWCPLEVFANFQVQTNGAIFTIVLVFLGFW